MNLDQEIRDRLTGLNPTRIELHDESGAHAGHASAGSGAHLKLTVVSEQFAGKSSLERHRMVYDALGQALWQQVHALSVNARTPAELA